MTYDYYYGTDKESYTFFRVPKELIYSPDFKELSDSAKLLYSLMLDRLGLSFKNNWTDELNRIYIYFKIDDVCKIMRCGKQKAVAMFKSLENYGLIERESIKGTNSKAIYMKKAFEDIPAVEAEIETLEEMAQTTEVYTKGEVCSDARETIKDELAAAEFDKKCIEYNSMVGEIGSLNAKNSYSNIK